MTEMDLNDYYHARQTMERHAEQAYRLESRAGKARRAMDLAADELKTITKRITQRNAIAD